MARHDDEDFDRLFDRDLEREHHGPNRLHPRPPIHLDPRGTLKAHLCTCRERIYLDCPVHGVRS